MKIKNIWLHFRKICIHKYYVGKYCWKMGLYWQGITHDLSKFSPIEFWESVKYYQGNRSPIDACKEDKGFSNGWLHHKGRNKHHHEYWQDNLDSGGQPLIIPKKYAMELIADYLGAGKAYMGKNFSYIEEAKWWDKRKSENPNIAIHPAIKNFITLALTDMAIFGYDSINAHNIGKIYDEAINSESEE